ncbi:MAG: S8 family serine peptidase [Acidimicrobiales bacterium]|nr:S8 family serine peptidase [Acidimicrobiales bacterium]
MRHRLLLCFAFTIALVVGFGVPAGADEPVASEPPAADATTPVIVELVDLGLPGDAPTIAGLLALDVDGLEATGALDDLDILAAEVTPEAFAALEASAIVESIRPAREDLRLLLDVSTTTVGATALQAAGTTGDGKVVAVIDSGVDDDHPGLIGSVIDTACYLDGVPTFASNPGVSVTELCKNGTRSDTSAEPCSTIPASCSHGTAVAGVISGDDETLAGVAPDAGIMALRVTAVVEGLADESDPEYPYSAYIPEAGVLAALEHVYSMRSTYDIAAVNLSLGGDPGSCTDAAWEDVIGRLTDAGIAVVAASGNYGWEDSITFPACLPDVISVGATTVDGEVASFTSSSTELDLLAPGSPVETTVLASYDASGFASQQGTSFSAPHVAAAFALVDDDLPGSWSVERRRSLLRVAGEMVERVTANPFDRDPRFPELRVESVVDFEPFDDAGSGFWVIASDWAKFTGVSTGLGGNDFGPDEALTRAQAVTFLWRFMGSPDHGTETSFVDVDPEDWHAAAVAWAADVSVTTGTTPTTFEPDLPVDRGQLATFMWRTAGEPTPSYTSGFVDVDGGDYFADAVDWMAEHDITTGTTPTTFSPHDTVTRAQMVTFEYRLASADNAWAGSVEPPELALF